MATYEDEGYAFPPQQITSYLSLSQFIMLCNQGLEEHEKLNRKAAEGIALSGILDKLSGIDGSVTLDLKGRLQIAPEAVAPLQQVEKVNLEKYHQIHGDQDILNVRVRPARTVDSDDGERKYMGWHAKLTEEEARLGVTRWWSKPYRDDITNMPFLATINGFVVYSGIIRGIEKTMLGLVAFDVCTDESDAELGEQVRHIRESFLYKRVDSPRGGNIAYL